MKFRELVAGAGLDASHLPDIEITKLAYSDRSVTGGALFFCVEGLESDGHDFAPAAVERGAVALVCRRKLDLQASQVVVPDVRASMAPVAASFFGNPSAELTAIGVTGTNGKTTTTFLVRHMLERSGTQTGMLGTVAVVIGGESREVERTTPEAVDLQRTFRQMLDCGDLACVMEVTSHALELHRADAIAFDCVVFTNLTWDHLDFHGTLDRYFGAKRSLFVSPDAPRPRSSIVNLDDEWGRKLAGTLAEVGQTGLVTYALDNDADYCAERVVYGPGGSSFRLRTPVGDFDVEMPLPGRFNVYNSVAAVAACVAVGVEPAAAVAALADAPSVPGRFESIDEGQPFSVLVDYAHTPDSLENALRAARDLLGSDGGRLICVFGAGGDRDRDKRPLMGEAASSLADRVIVTSDNPRSEAPGAIIAEIVAGSEGAPSAASSVEVEVDRRAAIAGALDGAMAGDIVLIAGKGHEQEQEFERGRKLPFDDRDVARELLREPR